MTTTETQAPAFDIQWSDPADQQLFWFQDNLHFPQPQTPLNGTLFQTAFEEGASAAISRLSMPKACALSERSCRSSTRASSATSTRCTATSNPLRSRTAP